MLEETQSSQHLGGTGFGESSQLAFRAVPTPGRIPRLAPRMHVVHMGHQRPVALGSFFLPLVWLTGPLPSTLHTSPFYTAFRFQDHPAFETFLELTAALT